MSKNTDKKLCEYINILENLIKKVMENTDKKNCEVNQRIDKLKNLLAKRGITPEEIEYTLSLNEPYNNNLELLKNELINENISFDMNNIQFFQNPNSNKNILEHIRQEHLAFKAYGINLDEEEK